MPILDWNAAVTWSASYRWVEEGCPNTRAPIVLGYHRGAGRWADAQARAAKFVEVLGITTTDRIAIIGAGYGWTVEALVALGFEARGTDVSSYIQGTKGTTEDADYNAAITAAGLNPASGEGAAKKAELIAKGGGPGNRSRASVANEDLANNASRNRVRNLFAGGRITVAISEDLLPWLTDAEISTQASRIAQLDPGNLRVVAHYLTPMQPDNVEAYNWKLCSVWRSLLELARSTQPLDH